MSPKLDLPRPEIVNRDWILDEPVKGAGEIDELEWLEQSKPVGEIVRYTAREMDRIIANLFTMTKPPPEAEQ